LLGQKIRGCDTFSKCKSRGVGYRVSHGSPLKMYSRARFYGVTYVKLKDIASVIRINGEGEYKIMKFSAYYETHIYRGPIRHVRQIRVGVILKQGI